jgi:hypothetical protein
MMLSSNIHIFMDFDEIAGNIDEGVTRALRLIGRSRLNSSSNCQPNVLGQLFVDS